MWIQIFLTFLWKSIFHLLALAFQRENRFYSWKIHGKAAILLCFCRLSFGHCSVCCTITLKHAALTSSGPNCVSYIRSRDYCIVVHRRRGCTESAAGVFCRGFDGWGYCPSSRLIILITNGFTSLHICFT